MIVKKGDLFFADLSPVVGSEQGGVRPVLVVQNDVGGLSKDSVVLLEQLRTIDKQRLKERIGALNETQLPDVEKALSVSLGIANSMENR